MGHYGVSGPFFLSLTFQFLTFILPVLPNPNQEKLVYRDMAAFTDNYTKSHLTPHNNVVSEPFRRKIGSQLAAAEMSSITSEKLKKNPKIVERISRNFKKCAASLVIVSWSHYICSFSLNCQQFPSPNVPFLYCVENLAKKSRG